MVTLTPIVVTVFVIPRTAAAAALRYRQSKVGAVLRLFANAALLRRVGIALPLVALALPLLFPAHLGFTLLALCRVISSALPWFSFLLSCSSFLLTVLECLVEAEELWICDGSVSIRGF